MPPTEPSEINNVWASNTATGSTVMLTTPSGQTCRVQRLGLAGLVTAGILPEGDSLTSFVDKRHIQRVRGANGAADHDEINMESIMKDSEQLGKLIMMIDRVMPVCITSPTVVRHFTDEPDGTTRRVPDDQRAPGVVYTDQIDFNDKMFVFNFTVGGTADAAKFSDEANRRVATLEHGPVVSRDAVPTSRAARRRSQRHRG